MKKILLQQLILMAFTLTSCTDKFENANLYNQSSPLSLTPEEYASIAYDNPKELSEKEIADIIYDFRNIQSQFRKRATSDKEKPQIYIHNKYYLTNNNISSRSKDSIQINIPIFEIELINDDNTKDITIVCGDERAPKILLYAKDYKYSDKMNIDIKYLNEIAKLSILSDIKSIEKLKTEKRTATLNKISKKLNIPIKQITQNFIKQNITTAENNIARYNPIGGIDITEMPSRIISMVPSMSEIVWHQEAPYNFQMPIGDLWDGGKGTYKDHYLVGCANIAVATLFSILKPPMVGETSTGRQILIDWDYITSQKTITNSSPTKMTEMVSSLLRRIYNKTKSFPDIAEIDTYDEDNNPIKKEAIVSTSTSPDDMLKYLQTMTTYAGDIGFNPDLAKQSLLNYNPVLLYGTGHYIDDEYNILTEGIYKNRPGHGWIIDGYCITKKTGQPTNDLYWSVNMGWGNNSSTVYFKSSDNALNCDVIFSNGNNVNIVYYTQEQKMIYDIQKK